MTEAEPDAADIREWLARAVENTERCFVCKRIAEAHSRGETALRPLRISGIELSPETQITHLRLCVGR